LLLTDLEKTNTKFIPKAEIIQKEKALKGNVANYELTIVNNNDPPIQLADTRGILKEKLETLTGEKRKGLKFNVTLKVRFRKETEDGTIYSETYFTSRAKTITNKNEILKKIKLAEEEILNRIADWLSEDSQWVIDESYITILM